MIGIKRIYIDRKLICISIRSMFKIYMVEKEYYSFDIAER